MSDLILYTSDDGQTRMNLRVDGETFGLHSSKSPSFFKRRKQNVSIHTKNIFDEGELSPEATVKESLRCRPRESGSRPVTPACTIST